MAKPLWPNVSNIQYRNDREATLVERRRERSRER